MADPLSIAISVASLVGAASKILHMFNVYRAKDKNSDLTAVTIKVQCDCILVALGQIQAALLSGGPCAARLLCTDSISGQALKSVLGACEQTFTVIISRLSKLNGGLKIASEDIPFRTKLDRLWNESEVKELDQNILRLSQGLNLLLTAINVKSQIQVQEILTSERASIILEKVVDDASSVRLSDCRSSVVSQNTALGWEDVVAVTEVDPKDFSFDQEVLMTKAYRRVRLTHQAPKPIGSVAEYQDLEDSGCLPLQSMQQIPQSASLDAAHHRQEIYTSLTESRPLSFDFKFEFEGHDNSAQPSNGRVDSRRYQIHELEETYSSFPKSKTTPKSPSDFSNECTAAYHRWPEAVKDLNYSEAKNVTLLDFLQQYPPYPVRVNWKLRENVWINRTELRINNQKPSRTSDSEDAIAIIPSLQALCTCKPLILKNPAHFPTCKNLLYLNLRNNNLNEIPAEISHLTSIKTLHLSGNYITHLPPGIRNLDKLRFLNISSNLFTSLPPYLAWMQSLRVIAADDNPYQDPPLQTWQSQFPRQDDAGHLLATIALKTILANLRV